jgi:DNA-binding GntR family transcriptional regulator
MAKKPAQKPAQQTAASKLTRRPMQPEMSPFATKELEGGGTKQTLVQRVHETLLQGFDEGIFLPGERIKAAQLAKRLGLSRAPVREALHVLAGQGLVELLPDKGAVLRSMSLNDLIEIYEVSAGVAAFGVATATRRIGEGDNAERVKRSMERIRDTLKQEPSYAFYDRLDDFHYILNEIAEKPYVSYLMRVLNLDYWHRFLAANIDLARHIPRYVENYQRMADAILAGDWRASEAIMYSHAEWAIGILQERS